MSIDKKRLANKVYKLRKSLNLSQEQFSETTKLKLNTIQLLELAEYDGNMKTCINSICKNTKADTSYFDTTVEKTIGKLKPEIIESCNAKNDDFDEVTENIKTVMEKEVEYLMHNNYNIQPTTCDFYENECNTYQLKNHNKTRICAFCGTEIDIVKKKINYDNVNYYIFKCNCNDFLVNSNISSEQKRFEKFVLKNKLLSQFDRIFKEKNFDFEYYDLAKGYFELKISVEMIMRK